MPGIVVVTDSTASLPPELARAHGIHVQPVHIFFGDQGFRDGVDLTPTEFYRRLRASPTLPTTSQPSVGDFVDLYTRLSQHSDAIVSIHLAKELSATLDSARAAQQLIEGEAASKGQPSVPIHVLDSRSVAMGLGFTALAAARAAMAGKGLQEVIQAAEAVIPRLRVIFTVDTLEYLRRGGRIGGAAALVGTVLNIKPILHLQDGRIAVLEKVRTKKTAMERLVELMAEQGAMAGKAHVAVLHADALQEAQRLAETISARFDCAELYVTDLCAVVSAHVGPGALGLIFYVDP